jgi:CRISPR-associated protein Cas1
VRPDRRQAGRDRATRPPPAGRQGPGRPGAGARAGRGGEGAQRGEAAKARSEASLRGIEGAAAAAWYGAWTEFLTRDDPVFVFDGRSRRPPKDGVNALLSYLYAVLAGSAAGAAAAAGLDPAVGFLHGERPGRPALALDLAEPFRVAVVDATVIAALNEGQFGEADVTPPGEDGVRLTDQGRRRALAVLERQLSTAFRDGTQDVTWRGAVAATAQRLGAALRGGRAGCAVPLPAA